MSNTLKSDKALDKHFKVIKSGEEHTSLELATEGNGAKIKGDLEVTGSIVSISSSPTVSSGADLTVSAEGRLNLRGSEIMISEEYGLNGHPYLYWKDTTNYITFQDSPSSPATQILQFVNNSIPSATWYQIPDLGTGVTYFDFNAGTITAADATNTYNKGLFFHQTLNDTSDSGSSNHTLIYGAMVNTDITGWDELYLMQLGGAGTFWVNNAASISIPAAQKVFFDGGTDAANGHSYITESSDDVLDFYVGADKMLSLDEANDKITMSATKWVAGTVSGGTVTEFSAGNSAYAGMILGYTRLQGDLTNQSIFEIQNSITVEDDTHKITFKTPPSEMVEIEATFTMNISTTSTMITAGLSDADASTGYNSIGVQYEYDYLGVSLSDGEADDGIYSCKWVLPAAELAAVGSSNSFWIGFGTAGSTKTAWLTYGVRASHGIMTAPFIIKATALPEIIYEPT